MILAKPPSISRVNIRSFSLTPTRFACLAQCLSDIKNRYVESSANVCKAWIASSSKR